MGNKRKGQLTTDGEWHKHLRKIGKRFFWKGERIAERKMIEQNLTEMETDSAEILYEYLNLKLKNQNDNEDLNNLCLSLFCTKDILPKSFNSLEISKEVLINTFTKIAIEKDISEKSTENYWRKLIEKSIVNGILPKTEQARKILANE